MLPLRILRRLHPTKIPSFLTQLALILDLQLIFYSILSSTFCKTKTGFSVMFAAQNFSLAIRLGPSASEVHEHKLDALVKSLSHIQHVLEDPSMREVIGNLAPQLLNLGPAGKDEKELRDAEDGKPAPARPKTRKPDPDMPPPPPPKKAKVVESAAPEPAAEPDEPDEAEEAPTEPEINSSTHRAAHARLVRRMEKANVADFPHMTRLWNGGRKDARRVCVIFKAFSISVY